MLRLGPALFFPTTHYGHTPTMASEYNIRDRSARIHPRRLRRPRQSFEIPERLRHGEDEDEDVTAPKSNDPRYTHRSVFDLITHAGSVANLRSRFTHDELSESEEEDDHAAVTRSPEPPSSGQNSNQPEEESQSKHRRSLSNRKIFRHFQKLNIKTSKERRDPHTDEAMSSSQILTPKPTQTIQDENEKIESQSVSSQIKAKTEIEASAFGSDLRTAHEAFGVGGPSIKDQGNLSQRLMEIFGFDEEEKVTAGTCKPFGCSALAYRCRISVLVASNRPTPRILVHHGEAYLLLRLPSEENRKLARSELKFANT